MQQVPKIAEFQNDQESNGERSGIRSTLKAVNRRRQAFLLSEKLQGIANASQNLANFIVDFRSIKESAQ
jgi:hypothetical protein